MDELNIILKKCRGIGIEPPADADQQLENVASISSIASRLDKSSHKREADVLREVQQKCTTPSNFGGMGFHMGDDRCGFCTDDQNCACKQDQQPPQVPQRQQQLQPDQQKTSTSSPCRSYFLGTTPDRTSPMVVTTTGPISRSCQRRCLSQLRSLFQAL